MAVEEDIAIIIRDKDGRFSMKSRIRPVYDIRDRKGHPQEYKVKLGKGFEWIEATRCEELEDLDGSFRAYVVKGKEGKIILDNIRRSFVRWQEQEDAENEELDDDDDEEDDQEDFDKEITRRGGAVPIATLKKIGFSKMLLKGLPPDDWCWVGPQDIKLRNGVTVGEMLAVTYATGWQKGERQTKERIAKKIMG